MAITFVGAIAANLVGRTLIGMWEKAFNKTPIVRSIYKGSKQIFTTIFSKKEASFRSVCLVEWPRRDIWSFAFVSREVDGAEVGLEEGRAMYAIYISTTPNPTGGYVFFADKADVKILDMTVEDGLKFVISMGLVLPERPLSPAAIPKWRRQRMPQTARSVLTQNADWPVAAAHRQQRNCHGPDHQVHDDDRRPENRADVGPENPNCHSVLKARPASETAKAVTA